MRQWNTYYNMELSTNQIFQQIRDGVLAYIDMINYLERVTDNFKLSKLKIIQSDFNVFYYPQLHEFEDNFTIQEIGKAIEEYTKSNTLVPIKKFPMWDKEGEKYYKDVVDVEQLLYPMEFYDCRQFEGLIDGLIEKYSEIKKKENVKKSFPNNHNSEDDTVGYSSFKDIFKVEDWKIYISAFQKTQPPILDKDWNFIGIPKKHKGVICAWIKDLQQIHGVIKLNINRKELAFVVNREIKGIELGEYGKTFDNKSYEYAHGFEQQLKEIIS